MTCLEAQSKIIAYIEHKLDRNNKQEFLNHVRNCSDCKEELNIYYTMIEGMRQLDENEPLSKDFSADLDRKIEQEINANRKKKDVIRGSFVILFIGVFTFIIAGYVNFLNFVENQEQEKLKEAQGTYYYSDTFDEIIFDPFEERVTLDINVESKEPEPTFYEKIRQYEYLKK
ncbi:MAG: anti-sigma factor family protein [Lachnospiraceae bacterium]